MKIQLDFSSITIENAILKIEASTIEEDWLEDYLIFLKSYKNQTEFTLKTSGTTGEKKKIKVLETWQGHLNNCTKFKQDALKLNKYL